MYFVLVIALTIVLPVGSTLVEGLHGSGAPVWAMLFGKWSTFYAAGVRLFIAGVRQVVQPRFTLKEIFEIDDEAPLQIVQELGFANLSMGTLGLLALVNPMLTFAGALVGGLYYGFAGVKHIFSGHKNAKRNVAMVTDLFVAAALALYVFLALTSVVSLAHA